MTPDRKTMREGLKGAGEYFCSLTVSDQTRLDWVYPGMYVQKKALPEGKGRNAIHMLIASAEADTTG